MPRRVAQKKLNIKKGFEMGILNEAKQLVANFRKDQKIIKKKLEGITCRITKGKFRRKAGDLTDVLINGQVLVRVWNKRGTDYLQGFHYIDIEDLKEIQDLKEEGTSCSQEQAEKK